MKTGSPTEKQRRREQRFHTKLLRLQHEHLNLWFQFEELDKTIRALPYPARKHAADVLSKLIRYAGHAKPRDRIARKLALLEERRQRILEKLKSLGVSS